MTSLGTKLRETREGKGLSLEEISTRTKIRQCYLEAIEGDRLDSIPGGFFSRSFARQYAEELGVEVTKIEPMLDAVTPKLGEDVKLQKLTDYRSPKKSLVLPGGSDSEGNEFYHEAAFLKERRSSAGWMVAAALLCSLSIGYLAWLKRPDIFEPLLTQNAATEEPQAVTADQVGEPTPPAVVEAEAIAPAPTNGSPAAAHSTAPVVVEVKAVESTWLRLIADGRRTFGGTMEAGETRVLTGDESAVVFTGNAGGVELTYNGRPVGPVGPSGRIRTVVFTPENFEIRSTSPPLRTPGTLSGEGAVREP
jgi:cytoskeleton protein RodZ